MKTILLVEDNDSFRESMASLLAFYGYLVLQAPSGNSGLQMVQTHQIDAIVSDIEMPDGDGFEFLGHLLLANLRPKSFCFFSSKESVKLKEAKASGADAIFYKSMDLLKLLEWLGSRNKNLAVLE